MRRVTSIEAVRELCAGWHREGLRVGFVPTMGALHAGHQSLVRAARACTDRVVASVFVNPTQFGPNEDFTHYPRDVDGDAAKLQAAGCDALFTTTPEEMYPDGYGTWIEVEAVTDGLCGAFRPGHFRGVATVVAKLFQIVQPSDAFFGEKDRQQLAVIRRMVTDLNVPVRVHGCPTVREADGLALSSRNAYLTPAERSRALALSRGLRRATEAFAEGRRDTRALETIVREELDAVEARIDYVTAVHEQTMQAVERADEHTVIAIAAHVGRTRLIDNHLLRQPFPVPSQGA